ncbi:MAG TPA: hypothetical protein DEQ27_04020 [Prevotella sp.]|nr:hypothetical protein [Prevotella sp.]
MALTSIFYLSRACWVILKLFLLPEKQGEPIRDVQGIVCQSQSTNICSELAIFHISSQLFNHADHLTLAFPQIQMQNSYLLK